MKKKRTVFEYLKERFGEKPATREEIEQLKLNHERAKLKAEIAEQKQKAKKGNTLAILKEMFGVKK